ncbi:MAG: DUF6439 family protein [Leptolyngbyaceae cyanobacterium MO_188.B28]|nr:DUF6439 family protein [Leptolyngbyaceae cyanobacterium MO_188.B28]
MTNSTSSTQAGPQEIQQTDPTSQEILSQFSSVELAKALAERLAIQPNDWHRLNSNRKIRAQEQMATALVYLLNEQSEEAIARLQKAIGWLDRSISAPPCPTHKHRT